MMAAGQIPEDPTTQVENARKAFEQEFERFARFTGEQPATTALSLEQGEAEQRALTELRTRHLGKKSALAASKKMIGQVAAEERATYGQLVQQVEAAIVQKFAAAELMLKKHLEAL